MDELKNLLLDGSIKSRKFLISLLSLFLLTGIILLGIHWPQLHDVLPSFNAGLSIILGAYIIGNVSNKVLLAKEISKNDKKNKEAEEEGE